MPVCTFVQKTKSSGDKAHMVCLQAIKPLPASHDFCCLLTHLHRFFENHMEPDQTAPKGVV